MFRRFLIDLKSCQDLPQQKTWFGFGLNDNLKTIEELKKRLSEELSIEYDFDLFLENVLLSDKTSIGIIRDNEEVVVRRKQLAIDSNKRFVFYNKIINCFKIKT